MNTQQVKTVNAEFLTTLGFPKATAQQIIRQSKRNMVQQGYTIYNNRRLGTIPITAVEAILGFKLLDYKAGNYGKNQFSRCLCR